MSTTLLREAAAAIRAKAEAATPGPWEASDSLVDQSFGDYAEVIGDDVRCRSYCLGGVAVGPSVADAQFIAAMHPDVALAVADLLAHEADRADHQPFTDSAIDAAEVLAGRVLGREVDLEEGAL